MNKQPKIFVIVVTYKGMQWYDKCFTSLRESTMPVQTIVVDNTPGDEDANYIREHFPEIHLIKTEKNLGFGRANNWGLRYALDNGANYVFLLNQDTWVEPDMFEKLIDIAEVHPEYGILSPMHLDATGKHLNILINDGHSNYELLSDFYCGQMKDVYPLNYVNAAGWLLPRKTLEIMGGFDPIFRHYEEDDDYLNRARYHKLSVVLCPKARMTHDHTTLLNPLTNGKQRHFQYLLLEHTNLNKPEHINRHCLYLLRKVISSFLRGDMAKAKLMLQDYKYLRKNKSAILHSRNENAQKKMNWL